MEYKVWKMAQMVGKNIFNLLKRGDWCKVSGNIFDTLPQTNSSGEIPPFVDVFPIGKGGFRASYASLPEGILILICLIASQSMKDV